MESAVEKCSHHCYPRCFRWFRAEPRLPCWTVDAWVLGCRHRPLLLQGTRSSPGCCWWWRRQTSRPSVEFRPSLARRFRPRPRWPHHTRWARSAAWERTGTRDLTHSLQRHHFRKAAEGTAVGMRNSGHQFDNLFCRLFTVKNHCKKLVFCTTKMQ